MSFFLISLMWFRQLTQNVTSFPHFLQCASKHLLLDNDVDDFDTTYLLEEKIYMLFEKTISLSYILQMVMEISRISKHGTIILFIVSQCNVNHAMLLLTAKCLLAAILQSNSSSVWSHIVWWGLFFEDN